MSQFNIETYLFHTLTRGKSKLPASDFKKGLAKGEFIIILDGFDEVSYQMRDRVQRAIMDIAEDYDDLTIIVSSRPDDRFASWTSFDVVEVSPLAREDTIELISKAEFDETDKAKFIKKIEDNSFYAQHLSFLSNPLLASMMLLTFTQSYDIPDKTHQFYESAFDALYKRHDSYKPGGFKREFLSKADEDEFKRIFSYFCLLSYYEQSFTFTQNKIEKYMSQALTLSASDVSQSDFIKDLIDAVCLLIKEGVDYTFAHRSFQEYFAAYCISFVTSKNFRNIVDTLSRRPNDQVVLMIRDMNPEQLRDLYVVPVGEGFAPTLKRIATKPSVAAFFESTSGEFVVRCRNHSKNKPPAVDIFLGQTGPLADFVRLAIRLSGEPSFFGRRRVSGQQRDARDAVEIYKALKLEHGRTLRIRVKGDEFSFGHHATHEPDKVTWIDPVDSPAATEIFLRSRMHEFIGWQMKTAASYVAQETELSRNTTNAMQEIFGG